MKNLNINFKEIADDTYDLLRRIEKMLLPVLIAFATALAVEFPETAPVAGALFAVQRILAYVNLEIAKAWEANQK